MTIHPLTQHNTLDDLRFICKVMTSKLSMRSNLPPGRPGMRLVTNKVLDGTVTVVQLDAWYPRAVKILRKGNL